MVDAPAVLKVLPLSLSAGLLEVALALHSFNNTILTEEPGVWGENMPINGKFFIQLVVYIFF